MKILQIIPYFLPYVGGIERYVYNLSKILVKRGHEVKIITSDYPKTNKYEVIDGIYVERYQCIFRPLRNAIVPSFFKLHDEIENFDLIHIHNLYSFAALASIYYKNIDKPILLTHHGEHKFNDFIKDAFIDVYRKIVVGKILKSIDQIVVLSKADATYIDSYGISDLNISIIANAININDLEHIVEGDAYKKLDGYIILFVGQIIKRKGIETLLKSIPIVLNKTSNNNLLFVLVGDGEFFDQANTLVRKLKISKNVLFTGKLDLKDIITIYKHSKIFVLPSTSEGLPTSILEAMYFGLPVISTRIPSIIEHFKDIMLLIPLNDEKNLAEAIIKLINNNDLYREFSNKGKNIVREKYNWENIVDEYEKVYMDLIL